MLRCRYVVTVRSFNKIGSSIQFYDTVRTKALPTETPSQLAAPENVRALADSATSITVKWSDPSNPTGSHSKTSIEIMFASRWTALHGEVHAGGSGQVSLCECNGHGAGAGRTQGEYGV